jgi:hypothetical protein
LPTDEQSIQIAAWEFERNRCKQHGGDLSECADESQDWYPTRTVCLPSMVLASAEARYDALHDKAPFHDGTFTKWAAARDDAHPYHFRDGVTVWVSPTDVNPDDDFLSAQTHRGPDPGDGAEGQD